jgi:hypothetical protein
MNPHNNLPTPPEWPLFANCIRFCMGGAAFFLLASCASSSRGPSSEIVVSVKDQKLGLYHDGVLEKRYDISTSKFGLGDQLGSYKTPLGKHEVIAKIGHGLPPGAVLKSRSWNGEVLKPNAPGRDPIVSRILWLRGMEMNNRNAMKRFIYIHGTTEEDRLGKPASYGCIRMGMKDVVDLFNDVSIGAKVEITKDKLPQGAPKPAPPATPATPDAVPGADQVASTSSSSPAPATAPAASEAAGATSASVKTTPAAAEPGHVAAGPHEEPKAKKREGRSSLFGRSKTAQISPPEAELQTTVPEQAAEGTQPKPTLATTAPSSPTVITEPVPVETAPEPQPTPKRKGGFFSFLTSSSKAKTVEAAPPAETTDAQAPGQAADKIATDKPGPKEASAAPPAQTVAASPPANSAAPPDPAPSPSAEAAAPRKRSGFFSFFGRSKKPAPQVAAISNEAVGPERGAPGPSTAPDAANSAPATPEKAEAGTAKPKKNPSHKEGSGTTGRHMPHESSRRLAA